MATFEGENHYVLGHYSENIDTSVSSQNQPTLLQSKSARKHGQRTPNGIPGGAATFSTIVHTNPSSLEGSYLGHGKGQF